MLKGKKPVLVTQETQEMDVVEIHLQELQRKLSRYLENTKNKNYTSEQLWSLQELTEFPQELEAVRLEIVKKYNDQKKFSQLKKLIELRLNVVILEAQYNSQKYDISKREENVRLCLNLQEYYLRLQHHIDIPKPQWMFAEKIKFYTEQILVNRNITGYLFSSKRKYSIEESALESFKLASQGFSERYDNLDLENEIKKQNKVIAEEKSAASRTIDDNEQVQHYKIIAAAYNTLAVLYDAQCYQAQAQLTAYRKAGSSQVNRSEKSVKELKGQVLANSQESEHFKHKAYQQLTNANKKNLRKGSGLTEKNPDVIFTAFEEALQGPRKFIIFKRERDIGNIVRLSLRLYEKSMYFSEGMGKESLPQGFDEFHQEKFETMDDKSLKKLYAALQSKPIIDFISTMYYFATHDEEIPREIRGHNSDQTIISGIIQLYTPLCRMLYALNIFMETKGIKVDVPKVAFNGATENEPDHKTRTLNLKIATPILKNILEGSLKVVPDEVAKRFQDEDAEKLTEFRKTGMTM